MQQIRTLKENEYDMFMSFINEAFATSDNRFDFAEKLPKLYKREYVDMSLQYGLFEDGELCAVAGAFPYVIDCLGQKLIGRHIGNVAVDKKKRGGGYMTVLLSFLSREFTLSTDFMVLGGKRQRYQRFGFIPCSEYRYFDFSADDLPRNLLDYRKKFRFNLMQTASDESIKLHNSQRSFIERRKEVFADVLKTWYCKGFNITDSDGKYIGYLGASEDLKSIYEICINDENLIKDVILSVLLDNNQNKCSLLIPPYKSKMSQSLWEMASNVRTEIQASYKIHKWEKVLPVLLELKADYLNLPSGKLVLKTPNGNLLLELNVKKASAKYTEEASDIECISEEQLYALLFGPDLSLNLKCGKLSRTWFPLPIYIGILDRG